jgi:hypothetical protein
MISFEAPASSKILFWNRKLESISLTISAYKRVVAKTIMNYNQTFLSYSWFSASGLQ